MGVLYRSNLQGPTAPTIARLEDKLGLLYGYTSRLDGESLVTLDLPRKHFSLVLKMDIKFGIVVASQTTNYQDNINSIL